jgi:hypothetical protein
MLRPLRYRARNGKEFVVEEGQKTDFASVPRPFVWLVPVFGKYTRSAILHDYLWRNAVVGRGDADGLFRQSMRLCGVAFLLRWMMWAAVRLHALGSARGRKQWARYSWQLLLVLPPVLPIVLPAALVIAVSLGVYLLLEAVLYPVLWVGQQVGRLLRRPAKKINRPQPTLKT